MVTGQLTDMPTRGLSSRRQVYLKHAGTALLAVDCVEAVTVYVH